MELNESEEKLCALKFVVAELNENIDIDCIKDDMISKYNILNQFNASIHSAILSTEESAKNNMKLWETYHHDLDLCHQCLVEQEKVLSLYNGSIYNLQHLDETIAKLKVWVCY